MKINIPETDQKRVVIIGGGFAGISAARKLAKADFQVVLIDKNNYHQFQPLFYQVAMAGLEPSSISFPFRKLFRKKKNVFIRVTEVTGIKADEKQILTDLGFCNYDYLIVAVGADTNYYGNEKIKKLAIPMKSVGEALMLRNMILTDFEKALSVTDYDQRQGFIDIVIVGGGATGVELAGALAEMKKYILPKDYPELICDEIDIYLVQGADCLLKGMSEVSSEKALHYLKELDVKVLLNNRVEDYDGEQAILSDGTKIPARKLIWAAGITGNKIPGIAEESITYGNRLAVNRFSEVQHQKDIFAVGDIAYMEEEAFPKGHPQVAQVAIQQGLHLAKNIERMQERKELIPFSYRDKGSMATIGRNRAVVDLPSFSFQGFMAWLTWLVVHLFSILGTKNKVFVFLNWVWNYITYDQSLRLIIKTKYKDTRE